MPFLSYCNFLITNTIALISLCKSHNESSKLKLLSFRIYNEGTLKRSSQMTTNFTWHHLDIFFVCFVQGASVEKINKNISRVKSSFFKNKLTNSSDFHL